MSRGTILAVLVLLSSGATLAAGGTMWRPLAIVDEAPAATGTASQAFAPQIFNGQETSDYPAVAAVGVQFTALEYGLCTGTLIAPDVVLTAAHCIDRPSLRVAAAFLFNGTQENHAVAEFAVHPEHVPGSLNADVALLRLATPVQGVTAIPIAPAKPRPGRTATVVGFGEDERGRFGHRAAGTVRLGRCPRTLRKAGLRPRGRFVCWRADRGGANTCEGDSGGPLLVNGRVAGITLGGTASACGPGRVSIETSVAAFRSWIEGELR